MPPRRDALILFLTAVSLYLLLGQDTLYRVDGHFILVKLSEDWFATDKHYLAIPLFSAVHRALSFFADVPPHRSVTIASALGMAGGLAFTHRACAVLGMSRRQAALAAAVCATLFPCILFATVVEYHGAFFAFSQFTLWLAARLVREPSPRRAILLAVAAAIATMIHGTGITLGFLLACWFFAARRLAGLTVLIVTTQLALYGMSIWILRHTPLWHEESGTSLRETLGVAGSLAPRLGRIPEQIVYEFLLPFAPMTIGFLAAMIHRKTRAEAAAVAIGILPLAGICAVVFVHTEFGAYFLPAAALATVLVVRLVPSWIAIAVVLVQACAGIPLVRGLDDEASHYAAFVGALESLDAEQPSLLVLIHPHWKLDREVDELGAILVRGTRVPYQSLSNYAFSTIEEVEPHAHLLKFLLRTVAKGRRLLMTQSTLDRLADPKIASAGSVLLRSLETSFRFEPVRVPGFDGFELVDR